MSTISTHVLDTARGRPADGIHVGLDLQLADGNWRRVAEGWTNSDGRIDSFAALGHPFRAGQYRLTFDTRAWFEGLKVEAFYPQVSVVFTVGSPPQHYHVPLMLSPYGYSTYRGT
jgi:5-hydroxyisourate hydrolase